MAEAIAPVAAAPEAASPTAPAETPSAPAAPEPKPEPKSWKVGDKVVTDPDELYAIAMQSKAEREYVDRAMAESQKAQAFLERLRTNPREALADPAVGHDIKKLAVDWLKAAMEEESLTPEQKRIRELERSLKAREEQEAKAKAVEEEKQRAAYEQEARQHFVKLITDAMEQVKLPKTDAVAKRMATLMLKQHQMGLELPPVAIARLIEREIEEEHTSLYDSMDPKELLRRFPKMADKLRRAQLESLNVAPPAPAVEPEATRPAPKPSNAPIDFREAQRLIRERLKG